MKSFTITRWQVGADMPNKTHATVTVSEDIGGLSRLSHFELTLDQRFDSMSPEFQAAVSEKLSAAGLL